MSTNRFPPTSRYAGLEIAEVTATNGEKVPYLRRRFVPPSSAFDLLEEHRVMQGERLDLIAARRLGDPQIFWLICDANDAIRPEELTETTGRTLRITLPAGIPGGRGA
jgi:hypothetical protein